MVAFLNSEIVYLEWGFFDKESNTLLRPIIVGMVANAVVFYSQVYYIIPRRFKKGMWVYSFESLGSCLLITLLVSAYDILEIDRMSITDVSKFGSDEYTQIVFFNFALRGVWSLLAMAYRFPIDWFRKERQKEQLIKERLQSELDFLKAQINPHFLFNGINSIYHLINKDGDKAKETLLQFSGLLRYQIYDCQSAQISLYKEINYLKAYINMEAVRKDGDVIIDFSLNDSLKVLLEDQSITPKIAPLLITPFLENAFKFVSQSDEHKSNWIKVNMKLSNEVLTVNIANSHDDQDNSGPREGEGGLGLANVKKRLHLIYADRHALELNRSTNLFEVNLTLAL